MSHSKTDRKTLLVDLDNVVYPWAEVMAHLVAREGVSINMHPKELMELYRSWSVWDDWQVPEGGFNFVWERAIQTGEMWGVTESLTAKPLDRSVRALWQLSDQEWHIHLVTHRLNKFRLHDQSVLNTAEWLKWANIPYRGLTFTEDKHQILGDAIIDDNPNNLVGHPAPIKILYPAPHNQEWEGEPGVMQLQVDEGLSPWDEIVEILGNGSRS